MRPILDTHAHFYQVTRPGGVAWPPRGSGTLDRDHLPAHYEAAVRPLGFVGAVLVEASPLHEDTRWVEERATDKTFYPAFVAALDVTARDSEERLAELVRNPWVVGVRAFLWSGEIDLDDRQRALLAKLDQNGMTLDLISRKSTNPKPRVDHLAAAFPSLRIIINHLGGAAGREPSSAWTSDIELIAARPNVHMKLSAIFDMFNTGPDESVAWTSPLEVDAYRPHLDVIFAAFGPERVIFGSNWPVTEMSGSVADEVRIVEGYLEPRGTSVRDRVMHDNARGFYRRAI
jgi:L-fuconolactonase